MAELSTRDRLIETALQLIWQASYHSVSVDDICKVAGANKGSFYHFFPSKMDLMLAAMDAGWQARKEKMDDIFSKRHAPLERLRLYADAMYDMQKEKSAEFGKVCGCPLTSLGTETSTMDERLRGAVDHYFGIIISYYEGVLNDLAQQNMIASKDMRQLAEELLSFGLGVMTMAKIRNDVSVIRSDLYDGFLRILGIQHKKAA